MFSGVLAFLLSEYLTTPELRKSYDIEMIRMVMLVALVIACNLTVPSSP